MTVITSRLRSIASWQVTLGIALLALGFLIAAQLASEVQRVRYTTQERPVLVETALGLQGQQDALKDRILELRAQITELEAQGQGSAAAAQELNRELREARVAAGLLPLRGTGIVIQLNDSALPAPADGNEADYFVTAADVQRIVEELWLSGAEAIAINGERVTTSTAFVEIGTSILVNSAYLSPPYQVSALGPAELYDRLSRSEGYTDFIVTRVEEFGIQVAFAEPGEVDIPAFAGTVTLRNARPTGAPPEPGASPATSPQPSPVATDGG